MARNDGIDRTVARNQDLETPADVAKVQEHNEREKDSYSNQDIVPERTSLNVHFKAPIAFANCFVNRSIIYTLNATFQFKWLF